MHKMHTDATIVTFCSSTKGKRTAEETDAEADRTPAPGDRAAEDAARELAQDDMPVDDGMRLDEPDAKRQRPELAAVEGDYD
eukprot:87946-Amphidinium_carterae.1